MPNGKEQKPKVTLPPGLPGGMPSWMYPWVAPNWLGLQIPPSDEAAATAVTEAVGADYGLPPGYMFNEFGQVVKIPAGYVPPAPTGGGIPGGGTPSSYPDITSVINEIIRLQGLYPDRQFKPQWDADSGQYFIADVTSAAQAPTKYPREPGQPETWTDDSGNVWSWDEDANGYIKVGYDPTMDVAGQGAKAAAGAEQAWRERQLASEEAYRQAQLQSQTQQWTAQLAWQREQAQLERQEQERQYRAQLASQPMSWLQYASYTGEKPIIQPWMLPLSYKQYGWQVGGEIPGWTAESAQEMPELQSPSAQYWTRMGPTSQQEWLGYEQARTGIRPEESQFRLQSTAPPSGYWSPLRWTR